MKNTIDHKEDFDMVATTFFGLEDTLATELLKLGAKGIQPFNRAVSFVGDKGFMYKANLNLRTALRILKPIHKFNIRNEEDFYRGIKSFDWLSIMDKDDTLSVDTVLNTPHFNHSQFVSQKTKDAIVDLFKEKLGERPSVDKDRPTIRINVHIFRDDVTVALDSSGEILYKRGYREETNVAPLNEVLAAGMVLNSGWNLRSQFIDGMCGSGTILIEAALIANNVPPGYFRKEFGFMRWKDFDSELYDLIYEKSIDKISDHYPEMYGIEISNHVCKIAKTNIKNAKVDDVVKVMNKDFFDFVPDKHSGILMLNPPYGERLKPEEDINVLYKEIGNKMKKDFKGFNVWILSSNVDALKHLGLRPSKKMNLFNGPLECKFQCFEMYEGSKKTSKQKKEED